VATLLLLTAGSIVRYTLIASFAAIASAMVGAFFLKRSLEWRTFMQGKSLIRKETFA
jgi:hypothetical protein